MDEEFTTTAYPNVQENLKLPTEDQVRLEEPASSAGTLSSLENLDKVVEKSQEDEPEKTNTESEVQSMVTVPIHQDTSFVPLMTTPVIDLTVSQPITTTVQAPLPTSTATVTTITTTTSLLPPLTQPQQGSSDSILIQRIGELEQHMADLLQDNLALEERLDKHGSRLYKLENLDIPHQVSKAVDEIVTDAVDWAIQAPLRDRFRDLPEADMKEILHHRMWETKSYEAHEDHKKLYEALEKKKKRRHESPKTPPGSPPHQPPPPPPPAGPSGTSGASGASGSSQLPPPPPPPSTNQSDQSKSTAAPSSSKTATSAEYTAWTTTDTRLKPSVSSIPEDLHMDADSAPDEQVHSSDDEDIGNDHIPKVNLKQDWWKPLLEEDRPATPEPAWSIPSSDLPVLMNNWASALASTYAPPPENLLLAQTGDMAIFMDWFCKKQGITELTQKDLEGLAFEIVKVFHPNYLRYGSKGGKPALSISKMKAACYPDVGLKQMEPDQMWIDEECKYGIADKYIIAERDFKYLYQSDFEDLYLLNLQGYLNYLLSQDKKILSTTVNLWIKNLVIRQRVEDFQMGIKSYQTQLNLTKPRWDATGFEFKHDFTVIDSPRAVIFRDKYRVQMIMRFNEIHKFSDDTLKDVERSKEFMFAIQKWLKTRRIFRNLESFVGERIREGDYRLLQRTE
ncbi:hypothetical protein Tco_1297311 [Tanacetum coccineum]